jgi:hypothetical protein
MLARLEAQFARENQAEPGRVYRGVEEDFAFLMYFYPFERIELEIIQPLCGSPFGAIFCLELQTEFTIYGST